MYSHHLIEAMTKYCNNVETRKNYDAIIHLRLFVVVMYMFA